VSVPEYLTTAEAAAFLRVTPKTLRNKVGAGIFREGEHFFRRPGLGPRWKREVLVRWLEADQVSGVDVPLAESSMRGARWV
jgi:Helix-turn-helix domain